jgi:hypothetical protein
VAIRGLDSSGKEGVHTQIGFKPDPAWKTYTVAIKLDEGKTIKQVRVELNCMGLGVITGYIDYSRVELTFK